MSDLPRLQDAQYELLPTFAAEYARAKDLVLPLWSITHIFKGQQPPVDDSMWMPNWLNVASLYVNDESLTLIDISEYSGIPLRSIEARSGRAGWKQAKRTHRLLVETSNVPDLKTLEETVRRKEIDEFLTQSGYEVGRHAMQALLKNVDKIEPRDVAGLMQAAMKLLSMGEKMPSDYKYSKVENPQSNQQLPNVNILNITPERAEELLDNLRKRASVLDAVATDRQE